MEESKMKNTILIYLLLFAAYIYGQQNTSYHGEITSNSINQDYHVIRGNNKLFTTKLLIGDTIIVQSGISNIKILIDKYAKIDTIDKNTFFINYNDFSQEKSIVEIVLTEIKDFFSPYKHIPVPLRSSRGEIDSSSSIKVKQDILGNQRVTMLTGFNFILQDYKSGILNVRLDDSDGKNIFSLSEGDQMTISPADMNINSGTIYYLTIVDSYNEVYKIKLNILDNEVEKGIINDLKQLDELAETENRRLIYYATYFQLISDQSKKNIYLYWLSYQILNKIEEFRNDEDSTIKFNLLNRYLYYLEEF